MAQKPKPRGGGFGGNKPRTSATGRKINKRISEGLFGPSDKRIAEAGVTGYGVAKYLTTAARKQSNAARTYVEKSSTRSAASKKAWQDRMIREQNARDAAEARAYKTGKRRGSRAGFVKGAGVGAGLSASAFGAGTAVGRTRSDQPRRRKKK
jgi:hypothetical protein